MKAVLVTALSPDLSGVELAEVERPRGEVVVRMRAASLNYPDLLMTRGDYQFKPEPPFIAGLEMAGEVVEAAPGSGFAVGDRVRGGAKTGAFAEYVALPASALRHMPEGMDFPAAAAMGAAYHTAYVALVEIGGLQ
ncbi:MAG TPA: NADPH:quinone oxidoreductase, partial [Erythrobacter sp.]|nr:NADPH:quinone oxidoreductase [Erythrobacter sp.]